MFFHVWIFFLFQLNHLTLADHYKGGSLSWKPTNPFSLTSPVQITITERQSWTFSRYPCNETIISTLGIYNDTQNTTQATLTCISSTAACTSSLYSTLSSPLYCTDFTTFYEITTGTYYTQENLALNSAIDISWRGASWAAEILTNDWSLVTHIDLTPVNGKINTSPVTGSLPIFQFYVGVLSVIQILAYDWDSDQTVRCRWSNQYPLDECGDVCLNLPNAVLNPIDCSVTWTPVLRSEDVANGLSKSTYVVAITAEDFTNASSTTALSSVPHQILVYVSSPPAGVCASKPSVSGFSRRNLACYAVSVGSTNTFHFRGSVSSGCPNASIVDFISTSPLSVNRSELYQISNYTWGINVTWIPTSDQTGLQPFCIASVDNKGQTSNQYCVMIAVGGYNPSLATLNFVQGTASPLGTVMATQTRFSIQATSPLKRTKLNGTYIYISQLGGGLVRAIDCKYSPDVFYLNQTLVFFVTNPPWILGATYVITMTEGVATADYYCGTESSGFSGTWRFTIWNPSVSSSTTYPTTTTTATTHTVTTRGLSTTTYNTIYTTTGISAYITSTTTTTTQTTSTTATTTTTTTATTSTTTTTTTTQYIPSVDVIYPKDMELGCVQPVTIGTFVIAVLVTALHLYGLITLFVKTNAHFEKEILRMRHERRTGVESALNPKDHEENETENEEDDNHNDEKEEEEVEEEEDDDDAEVESIA